MRRAIGLFYGVFVYFFSFLSILYLIGFVGSLLVPKSINTGTVGPMGVSVLTNLVLLVIFALQNSVMARPGFKKVWTRIIPNAIERSSYILASTCALILLMAFWKPMPSIIWDVRSTSLGMAIYVVFWAGWGILLSSTFMIDHFDLFGLRQVYLTFKQRELTRGKFHKRFFYKLVRHPIMTGFLISFWATPMMTAGHFLFAISMTIYIYVAVKVFEEKDLIAEIGQPYIDYQAEVGPFFPGIGKSRLAPKDNIPSAGR
jgi:protein-S-isoprenylcysteine O-methyltransferase Ste14